MSHQFADKQNYALNNMEATQPKFLDILNEQACVVQSHAALLEQSLNTICERLLIDFPHSTSFEKLIGSNSVSPPKSLVLVSIKDTLTFTDNLLDRCQELANALNKL